MDEQETAIDGNDSIITQNQFSTLDSLQDTLTDDTNIGGKHKTNNYNKNSRTELLHMMKKQKQKKEKKNKKRQQNQKLQDKLAPPVEPLMGRKWIYSRRDSSTSESPSFSLVCYNILCQSYARSAYFPYCNPKVVRWQYRRGRMLDELLCYGADILCLQEVDKYDDFLREELKKRGYASCFKKRTRGKPDGCATFWKSNRFELVYKRSIELNDAALMDDGRVDKDYLTDNVAVAVLLRLLNGKDRHRYVCVVNTHLFWNPLYADVKLMQTHLLLKRSLWIIETFKKVKKFGDSVEIPLVLCGDFNSLPDSDVYQLITQGRASITRTPPEKKKTLAELHNVSSKVRHHTNPWDVTTTTTAPPPSSSSLDLSTNNEKDGALLQLEMDANNLSIGITAAPTGDSPTSPMTTSDELFENPSPFDNTGGRVDMLATHQKRQPCSDSSDKELLTLGHNIPMISVYPRVMGTEPLYTNYTEGFKGCLDYVFVQERSKAHGRGLSVRAVLEPVSTERMSEDQALPSAVFISDHTAIASILELD